MIPLNSRQTLPPNAFWYLALRGLFGAAFLMLMGTFVRAVANVAHGSCHGALCGVISAHTLGAILYFVAVLAVVHAVLGFQWFSFVLTQTNITINSGALWQSACTIRFDRIQDIDVIRGPLHMLLGLKSVAIWTASLDQRVGNNRGRPDGYIVLRADTADWLRDYLTNPGSVAADARDLPTSADVPRAAGTGLLSFAVIAMAVLAVFLLGWWTSGAPLIGVDTTSSMDAGPPIMVGGQPAVVGRRVHTHKVAQSRPAVPAVSTPAGASTAGASTAGAAGASTVTGAAAGAGLIPAAHAATRPMAYSVACAIQPSAESNGMKACAQLNEAERCQHEGDFSSQPTPQAAQLTVINRSVQTVKFYWLNAVGTRTFYAALPPGGLVNQPSHVGAHWLVATNDGRCVGIFDAATMTVGIF